MKKSNDGALNIPKAILDTLDQLTAAMQTPDHVAAVDALFLMAPKELGAAEVRATKLKAPKDRT